MFNRWKANRVIRQAARDERRKARTEKAQAELSRSQRYWEEHEHDDDEKGPQGPEDTAWMGAVAAVVTTSGGSCG